MLNIEFCKRILQEEKVMYLQEEKVMYLQEEKEMYLQEEKVMYHSKIPRETKGNSWNLHVVCQVK